MKPFVSSLLFFLFFIPVLCEGDTIYVPADYLTVQEAIDAAQNDDVIDISAGTYVEQLLVDNKTLTLQGAGQGVTVIESPAVLVTTFTTSADNKCVVGVINGGDLTMTDLTVDGLGLGNANNRFTGVGAHNSVLTMTDCGVLDIMDTPFSGTQHGIGVYTVNDDGTDRAITLTRVSASGYQKNGMTLTGANGLVTVTDCTTSGVGQTGTIAQNGIQISGGAIGTVEGCTVTGHVWTGGYWTSTGILIYGAGGVDVIDCPGIADNQMGAYYILTDGTFEGNTLTAGVLAHGEDGYYYGLGIDNEGIHGPKASLFDPGLPPDAARTTTHVDVKNCAISADQSGHGLGLGAWAMSEDNVEVDIITSEISGWEVGVEVWDDGTALPVVHVFACDIFDNTMYGINNYTTSTVNAQYNWWGDATGPYHPQWNPDGLGDTISDLVWFWPYLESPDHITVPWDYGTIQAAIDAASNNDTIMVAPGDYEEQLFVDNKSVNIIGAGKGVTNILCPDILAVTFTTSSDIKCVVGVINDGNLNLSNVTVDGLGKGNANYRMTGIGFRNTGGSVIGCEIKDIQDTPFSGAQHGLGIYALIDDGTDRNVDIIDCEVPGYQKNGITFNGENAIALCRNCTTTGVGQTPTTAQNGIQFGYGANGTVDGCTVIGNCYTGSNWTASGLLMYNAENVDIINCPGIIDNQTAVNFITTSGSFVNNTLTAGINAQGENGNYYGLNLDVENRGGKSRSHRLQPSAFEERPFTAKARKTYVVDVADSSFVADKTGEGLAINVWAAGTNRIITDITECEVRDWALGIQVDKAMAGQHVVTIYDCEILDNDTYGGVVNESNIPVNAKWNWWGHPTGPYHPTKNPHGQGNEVSDYVDFKPYQWLLPTTADPFSFLRVPQDYPTIQEAIDAASNGDTITVAAGDYEEQLLVDGKAVIIMGAGIGETNILSPATLATSFVTSADNKCVVAAINGADLSLREVTVDGQGLGNSNYKFSGVGFRNAGGAVLHCEIKDIQDTPFSGAQHGVGIYAYNNDGVDREVLLRNCTVPGYQKTGIALNGENVIARVVGCTTEGIGGTTMTAQNGIQVGFGAFGEVRNCTVKANCYTGSGWVATGVLLYEGGHVDVKDCPLIQDNQVGVYYVVTSGTFEGNYVESGINAHGSDGYYCGLGVDDLSMHAPHPRPFGEMSVPERSAKTGTTVWVRDCSFLADQTGTDSPAIGAWAANSDNIQVTITDSQIRDWIVGVDVWDDGTALPMVDISGCAITGNTNYGVINSTTELVTAEGNWWGDATGPYHAGLNPGGLGDTVEGYVWFANWLVEDPWE